MWALLSAISTNRWEAEANVLQPLRIITSLFLPGLTVWPFWFLSIIWDPKLPYQHILKTLAHLKSEIITSTCCAWRTGSETIPVATEQINLGARSGPQLHHRPLTTCYLKEAKGAGIILILPGTSGGNFQLSYAHGNHIFTTTSIKLYL